MLIGFVKVPSSQMEINNFSTWLIFNISDIKIPTLPTLCTIYFTLIQSFHDKKLLLYKIMFQVSELNVRGFCLKFSQFSLSLEYDIQDNSFVIFSDQK